MQFEFNKFHKYYIATTCYKLRGEGLWSNYRMHILQVLCLLLKFFSVKKKNGAF